MSVDQMLQYVPAYVLVFFRLAGMMLFAPLFGSSWVPKRLKVLLTAILAMAIVPSIHRPLQLPATLWGLAVGIGGEMIFGVAMGMILSFVFIAAQWAGEIIGQQLGMDLGEVFDPQFGGSSSVIGNLYYMLALIVFLLIGGHRAMLLGVRDSFAALPLLSIGMTQPLLHTVVGLLTACTGLALRLAAPILVTMLVLDVALGFISKTVPAFNVMSAGLSLRSILGMFVLIVGLVLTSNVMSRSILDAMRQVRLQWAAGG